MNDIINLMSELKTKKISLSLDDTGTNLKLKGDLAALTVEEKIKLKDSKAEIISLLNDSVQSLNDRIPERDTRSAELPLAPNQKGIWFHEKLEDLGTAYIIPTIYFLNLEEFSESRFMDSILHMVERYDVLQFIFLENENGEPIQKRSDNFDPSNHFSLIIVEDKEDLTTQIQKKNSEVFDYSKSPLWDITTYVLPENQYCFYLRIHHLIGDGESLELFIGELIRDYAQSELMHLQPVKNYVNYGDYISWITDKKNFTQSSKFWKSEFVNYSENFQLNEDYKNSRAIVNQGDTRSFSFKNAKSVEIKEWAQLNKVSLASLYTAATAIVLSKRGRSNDFVVGIPTTGRSHPQLLNALGNFVNTLPIRIQMDYTNDTIHFVQTVQKKYVSILEHQMYPFEYILDDIRYERKAETTQLFNVMISIPNNVTNRSASKNPIDLKKSTSLFDLTFIFVENTEEIELAIEYNTAKFNADTCDALLEEVAFVFEQILDNQTKLSDFTLAPKHQLEKLYNENPAQLEDNRKVDTVLDLLKFQVDKNPDSIAISTDGNKMSYRELYDGASYLASILVSEENVKPNDRIIVRLDKSSDWITAMYAIWLVGAIYVPVDPQLPDGRVKLILDDSTPKLIIDSIFLEQIAERNYPKPKFEEVKVDVNSIAYIIYTSGTTGRPKGVVINHLNLISKIEDEASLLNVGTESIMLAITNSGFDVSFLETILPLSYGGMVVLPSAEELQDTEKTIELIAENQITHLQGTPTYFTHLLSVLSTNSEKKFPKLKFICIGGESLNDHLVQQIKLKLPNVQINNHYGPTEITIDALVNQNVTDFKQNSIGNPFGRSEAYLIDDQGNLLPKNCIGELVIGGPSVFSGYWNANELNQQKRKQVDFSADYCYFTGDLALLNHANEFEFIGRKDNQVKLRGYRIELDDINQSLLQIPGVNQAHSEVIHNNLISWVQSEKTAEVLRNELIKVLPAYMIPQSFVHVESLPMTENGKVAVSKLPEPEEFYSEFVAPRTEIEQKIAAIWKEVLGVEQVGVTDNFFELGGHSLKITQLSNRYHKEFNKTLSIGELFIERTLEGHGRLVEGKVRNQSLGIVSLEPSIDYAVSYSQRRMWLLNQMVASSTAYHMPSTLRLRGELDVSRFKSAIEGVVDKHEILRTTFHTNDAGELRQQILTRSEINFQVIVHEHNEDLASILGQINELMQVQFDFENGPLLRTHLFKIADKDFVFYFDLHHIIGDGWSLELLTKEVMNLYTNPEEANKTLPFHYKDYAAWQKGEIEKNEVSKKYWLESLHGELPILDLPAQKKRPGIKTFNGKTVQFNLSQELTSELNLFCKDQGGTIFMGLLAMINALFSRYTNQQDLIIGTPIAGRSNYELENQVGMYVNTLPLRTTFDKSDSFESLFQLVKDVSIGAFEHQMYPFDLLVDDLKLKRDASRNPIFDVMLVLQNTSPVQKAVFGSSNEGTSLELEVQTADRNASRFDLTYAFLEENGILLGSVEFNTDIYSIEFINQLNRHFELLLRKVLLDKNVPLSKIQFMDKADLSELILDFNNTSKAYSEPTSIIRLFENQVEKTPNSIALSFQDVNLTYRELNEESNRLAHYLKDIYATSGDDLIGIKLSRDVGLIISMLAVLKSDAAYVPIDITYPQDRISYIENEIDAKVIIDQNELDHFSKVKENYSKSNLERVDGLDNLAYLIYTSGTTGNPKGVMITHSNASELIRWSIDYFDNSRFEVVYALTSVCFDLSVFEVFYPLSIGKRIRLLKNALDIPSVLVLDSAVLLNTVPSVVRSLVDIGQKLDNIGILNMAGEVIPPDLIDKLELNKYQVYNLYGPSEDTTYSTYYPIENNDYQPIPVGRPISNTQAFILDENLNLVPKGVKGTIFLAGNGITRGYFKKLELTNEKYLPCPFQEGSLMYNTGDLGRWLEDGNIEYCGREDFQVKIRGFRIELSEIETNLRRFSADLKDVVVNPREMNGEQFLVAYYASDEQLDIGSMKNFLTERIPNYMIPSYFVQLEQIPLSHNGKIDRAALNKIAIDGPIIEDFVLPRTQLEMDVVDAWKEVLNIERVGVRDNFFELGGNSLDLMKFFSIYQTKFGKQINLADLFQHTTPEAHAKIIGGNQSTSEIRPVEKSSTYPLSFGQKRLWILSQQEGVSQVYNMPTSFRVNEHVNAQFLNQAFLETINRHEILRTVFVSNEFGEPVQKILDLNEFQFELQVLDYSTNSEQTELTETYVREDSFKPFDLENGPLLRAVLFKLSEDVFHFYFNMHHIISDGWSMNVLSNDILQNYLGLLSNEKPQLPELRVQYKDFAHWQHEQFSGQENQRAKEYWKQRLKNSVPSIDLPKNKLRPRSQTFNGIRLTTQIDPELIRQLRRYVTRNNGTLFMGLMACWKTLFYRYTRNTDISVGLPSNGREHPALVDQIGFYVNTLVSRTIIDAADNFDTLFTKVKSNSLQDYMHQGYPFDEIVRDQVEFSQRRDNTLFEIALDFNSRVDADRKNTETNVDYGVIIDHGPSAPIFDVVISMFDISDHLTINFEFNTDVYEKSTMIQMLNEFKFLLSEIVQNPSKNLNELDYFPQETRKALLNSALSIGEENNSMKMVLDANMRLCSFGVVGDLYTVKFDSIEHKSQFLSSQTSSFSKVELAEYKIVHSGLEASIDANGELRTFGKKQDQIIVDGRKVDYLKIEESINALHGVKNSLFLEKITSNKERKFLVLFGSVLEGDTNNLKKEIKEHLLSIVSPSIHPLYIQEVESLDVLAFGRENRKIIADQTDIIEEIGRVQPETENEAVLLRIFDEVLGLKDVRLTDNFFDVVSDSIKSIQVISKLRQWGYRISVKDLFVAQIISEIAQKMTKNFVEIDQNEVVGAVDLTPIQIDFFKNNSSEYYHHFNQSVLLKVNDEIDESKLKECFREIVSHHDALRMTYAFENDTIVQFNNQNDRDFFNYEVHDLREENDPERKIGEIGEEAQVSFDLAKGPLFCILHFKCKDSIDYIGLISHHLVIDGVSWRILLEDMASLFEQSMRGEPFELPLKTNSFKTWSESIKHYSSSPEIKTSLDYWKSVAQADVQSFAESNEGDSNAKNANVFTFDEDTSQKLLKEVHWAHQTQINDVLLYGLGSAIKKVFGVSKTAVLMEGHGREEIVEGIDVNRTIGWFTSLYPFVLDVDSDSVVTNLLGVKNGLKSIPNKGIDYGILKYLTGELTSELECEIIYNYLGDFGEGAGKDSMFGFSGLYFGQTISPHFEFQNVLNCTGITVADRLEITLSCSDNFLSKESLMLLSDKMKEELTHLAESLTKVDDIVIPAPSSEYSSIKYSQRKVENRKKLTSEFAKGSESNEKNTTSKLSKEIFVVPAIDEATDVFHFLEEGLGEEFSVNVFQKSKVQINDNFEMGVHRIAQHHIESLKRIQQNGPYTIVGYSFGAFVAYEMTKQLEANGDKVEFLMLLDQSKTQPEETESNRSTFIIKTFEGKLQYSDLVDFSDLSWFSDLRVSLLSIPSNQIIEYVTAKLLEKYPQKSSAIKRLIREVEKIVENRTAALNYKIIGKVDAKITVVSSIDTNNEIDNSLGWTEHSDECNVVINKGNHFSLLYQEFVGNIVGEIKNKFN